MATQLVSLERFTPVKLDHSFSKGIAVSVISSPQQLLVNLVWSPISFPSKVPLFPASSLSLSSASQLFLHSSPHSWGYVQSWPLPAHNSSLWFVRIRPCLRVWCFRSWCILRYRWVDWQRRLSVKAWCWCALTITKAHFRDTKPSCWLKLAWWLESLKVFTPLLWWWALIGFCLKFGPLDALLAIT